MNILKAIEADDFEKFLEILDTGFKHAARKASEESRALGLDVVDGHADDGVANSKLNTA